MNFDGGRYYLTVLAPFRSGSVIDDDGTRRSAEQITRQTLATLPVAQQDQPSLKSGLSSPFSRVPRTHFVRIFILDELRYNGRRPSNAVYDLLAKVDLLKTESIDTLDEPYLVFIVDFDAASGHDTHLRSYTDRMWQEMRGELHRIFAHCEGFEDVDGPDGFFRFIKRCQVETTMPYHDYWTGPRPAWQLPRLLILGVSLVLVAALLLWVRDIWTGSGFSLIVTAFVTALAIVIGLIYRAGTAVWPAAPHSDIRSVLKALYLQQHFVDFAIRNQGAEDAELHSAFGAFLAAHRPEDLDGPTQAAGTLASTGTFADTTGQKT